MATYFSSDQSIAHNIPINFELWQRQLPLFDIFRHVETQRRGLPHYHVLVVSLLILMIIFLALIANDFVALPHSKSNIHYYTHYRRL
jgi:hypothetical protein